MDGTARPTTRPADDAGRKFQSPFRLLP